MEAVPQSWNDLKFATSQLKELLHCALALQEEARQERLFQLLNLIDLAVLSLPVSSPEHWDHVVVERHDYRALVCKAFPDFGYYNFIRPDTVGDAAALPDVNDAIDDLDEVLGDIEHVLDHEGAVGKRAGLGGEGELRCAFRIAPCRSSRLRLSPALSCSVRPK